MGPHLRQDGDVRRRPIEVVFHSEGRPKNKTPDVLVLGADTSGDHRPPLLFPLPDVIDEDDDIRIVVIDYETRRRDVPISITGCNRAQLDPRMTPSPS
jgi:hypothetical protein